MEKSSRREHYQSCRLCPRNCGVDRTLGQTGFCGQTDEIRLAWAGLHHGEEPPVSGCRGSGTLFFSGCTLGCAFCQNRQLSRSQSGRAVSVPELAEILLTLQREGAENINFVTGTHFIPGILEALETARGDGLTLPVVWNTSGYETPLGLNLLAPVVDLWLPDLKTLDPKLSRSLFGASDYPAAASSALELMAGFKSRGLPLDPEEEPSGDSSRADVIVRHLILPGYLESTRQVLEWYRVRTRRGILLSVMTQYMPVDGAEPGAPGRTLTNTEAGAVYDMLDDLGIEEGFFQGFPEDDQEGTPQSWEPDFNQKEPFPGGFSRGIWFWKDEPCL